MDFQIAGKVALVTASGRGLGLAISKRLAQEGCEVAICDFDQDVLKAAKTEIESVSKGKKVLSYHVDLTNPEEIKDLTSSISEKLGTISILVTNSGGPPPGQFDDTNDEKWLSAFRLVFLSATNLISAVLPGMKKQRWGRIINSTSRALKEPIPNLIISNAVRLSVGGMAKTLAGEVAQYGITVNNLCPGPTSTARTLELASARAAKKGISVEEDLENLVKGIPIGRLARPEEQAAAVAFLASELAGYITGISLLVDGGAVKAL